LFIKSVGDGGKQNLSLFFKTDTLDHLGEDFNAKFSIFLNLVLEGNHESASQLLPVVELNDFCRFLSGSDFIEFDKGLST
jgi:hypothetical protein